MILQVTTNLSLATIRILALLYPSEAFRQIIGANIIRVGRLALIKLHCKCYFNGLSMGSYSLCTKIH